MPPADLLELLRPLYTRRPDPEAQAYLRDPASRPDIQRGPPQLMRSIPPAAFIDHATRRIRPLPTDRLPLNARAPMGAMPPQRRMVPNPNPEPLTPPPFPFSPPQRPAWVPNPLPDSFGPRPDDFDDPVSYAAAMQGPAPMRRGPPAAFVQRGPVDPEPWRQPGGGPALEERTWNEQEGRWISSPLRANANALNPGAPAPRRGLEPSEADGGNVFARYLGRDDPAWAEAKRQARVTLEQQMRAESDRIPRPGRPVISQLWNPPAPYPDGGANYRRDDATGSLFLGERSRRYPRSLRDDDKPRGALDEAHSIGRAVLQAEKEQDVAALLRRPMGAREQEAVMVGALEAIEADLAANKLDAVRRLQRNPAWRAHVVRSAGSAAAGQRLLDMIDMKAGGGKQGGPPGQGLILQPRELAQQQQEQSWATRQPTARTDPATGWPLDPITGLPVAPQEWERRMAEEERQRREDEARTRDRNRWGVSDGGVTFRRRF